jgi:hypothetical protein
MAATFDRDELLAAFDRIGRRSSDQGTRLEIAVYGGSALILASNFRFATEDVDAVTLEGGWPAWLSEEVRQIAVENGWSPDWFNDAIGFHLSRLADRAAAHLEFGTFPRDAGPVGLVVHVPTADYMLALKLKASRVADPTKGPQELRDIANLIRAAGVRSIEDAIEILARYFPQTGAEASKQRFVLRHIWPEEEEGNAPRYPIGSR